MDTWTRETAPRHFFAFERLDAREQSQLLEFCNQRFPPATYEHHRMLRERALAHMQRSRQLLDEAVQEYPHTIRGETLEAQAEDLHGCAILFTAGGEGERLRLSLLKRGADPEALADFTKATWPLPELRRDYGALQTNLSALSALCTRHDLHIPVIVTTGPKDSTTASVIPRMLEQAHGFGLQHVTILAQDERLHLTNDEKIAWTRTPRGVRPVTQPDETGGPLMKLRAATRPDGKPLLQWLGDTQCERILVLQGTAIYDPRLLFRMAAAARHHDCLGVGIARESFPEDDPYGTYVMVRTGRSSSLHIVEQAVRNENTRALHDPATGRYCPYNTGFYVIDRALLAASRLPDYATPPKEIAPGIERSPKIGYAATDIVTMAHRPAVLTVSPDSYGVLKNADDLPRLSSLARRLGLDAACEENG
jgi:hypothetical protein